MEPTTVVVGAAGAVLTFLIYRAWPALLTEWQRQRTAEQAERQQCLQAQQAESERHHQAEQADDERQERLTLAVVELAKLVLRGRSEP